MATVVTTELEVRWGECDPAGIVYHPNYIDWFSVARMRLLGQMGVSYMDTFHDNGIVLAVIEVQCRYLKTLRAEDKITVQATVTYLSRTRMGLAYKVLNSEGVICAEGKTDHVFLDERNKAVNLAKRCPQLWDLLQRIPEA